MSNEKKSWTTVLFDIAKYAIVSIISFLAGGM